MPTSQLPTSQLPVPGPVRGRALARSSRPLPARVTNLPAQLLPLAQRSIVVAGAALAAEYALRAALGGTVERLLAPIRDGSAIIRTEVTEWMIVERVRRR